MQRNGQPPFFGGHLALDSVEKESLDCVGFGAVDLDGEDAETEELEDVFAVVFVLDLGFHAWGE